MPSMRTINTADFALILGDVLSVVENDRTRVDNHALLAVMSSSGLMRLVRAISS